MEKKSVLQTAFSELINGSQSSRAEASAPQVEGSLASMAFDEPAMPAVEARSQGNITHIGGNTRPCSIISKEMTIDGSIDTEGDIIIAGKIKGNIKCSGKLTLYGQIEGNINAQEVAMSGARVRGITICESNVTIDSATSVAGNIECGDLVLEGRVEGDIVVSGNAALKQNAYLLGDLQLSGISVEMGARIIGRVTTKIIDSPLGAAPAAPAARPAPAAPQTTEKE